MIFQLKKVFKNRKYLGIKHLLCPNNFLGLKFGPKGNDLGQ